MSDRKLVSVITPTWQRRELLAETIENVRAQAYRPLEHVVISDGPDSALRAMIESIPQGDFFGSHPPIIFQELGRNWSSYLPDSFCAAPNVVAQLLAQGAYQIFWADDERAEPDHVSALVSALEADDADFAYSRVRMYRAGQTPEQGYDIGTSTPGSGQITNALYKTDLLKHGLYPFRAGMTSDWACIKQWIDAGARWAFVDRVTLTHRIDH